MTPRKLVRFDGLAALAAGCVVPFVRGWIAAWSGVPSDVLLHMALITLCYASYSLTLSTRDPIPSFWLKVLIVGNSMWALVCVGVIVVHGASITVMGICYLLFEAFFVAALAGLEFSSLSGMRR